MEKKPQFVVKEMQLEDIEPATAMRLQSWLDTYVNDEAGVTREWIEQRNSEQLSDEKATSRRERYQKGIADGTFAAWVARDSDGNIIGSTTPFIDEDEVQHLGSLYVDKAWLGKGVGAALIQRAMGWFDPSKPVELGVVAYNERAKTFYCKWGFVEVPGSETLFADTIPETKMVRKGEN